METVPEYFYTIQGRKQQLYFLVSAWYGVSQAFFYIGCQKTKTQAQNSSQKLKKKLNLREAVSSLQEKLKEKTQF